MMIKEKGGKVLCTRTTYSSEKKRGVQKRLVIFPSWLDSVEQIRDRDPDTAAKLEALTTKEHEQLKAWLAERKQARADLSNRHAFYGLQRQLAHALDAIQTEAGAGALDETMALTLHQQMRKLQVGLKQLGYPRPSVKELDAQSRKAPANRG